MTIETLYSIGDEVWFMNETEPKSLIVTVISFVADSWGTNIYYGGVGHDEHLHEPECFPTKQDLLKSLE